MWEILGQDFPADCGYRTFESITPRVVVGDVVCNEEGELFLIGDVNACGGECDCCSRSARYLVAIKRSPASNG